MIYGNQETGAVPSLDLLTLLFDSEHCLAKEDTPLHAEAEEPTKAINKSEARLLTKQIAHFLRVEYGIGEDGHGKDIVASICSGQYRLPCFFFGVVAAGGVYSAVSSAITSNIDSFNNVLADPDTKVLLCSLDTKDLALKSGMKPSNILVLESYPEIQLKSADGNIQCNFAATGPESLLDWKTVTDAEELRKTSVCLIYSSGTTGVPKGVLISHANMVAEAILPSSINRRIWNEWAESGKLVGEPPLSNGYRTLAHLPPAHISGIQGYFVNPFLDGGIVYWLPNGPFDMMKFLGYNKNLKITTFFTAPPIYDGIAKLHQYRPALVDGVFRSLRVAYSGGAALIPQSLLAARADQVLGDAEQGKPVLISQTWGATETTGAVTHMPPNRAGWDTLGSVGALLPGVTMRLVDEDGRDTQPVGEALLKGPTVMLGYYKNPMADKAAFTEDGWLRTGDSVRVQDGLLYYVDRMQDVINNGASRVFPSELETVLRQHAAVSDVAVIGVPRGDQGSVPRAFVVLSPQATSQGATTDIIEQQLIEFVHQKSGKGLAGGVQFVKAIPRAPVGKILRRELEKMAK
ncbi:putative acyl-coenzyme A synthetase [Colletotrichum sp. SAR 10_65]|nr:putative acyl-coenzyme A synthetase [Colletotrichum sp. SAR 10_65]KAI8256055.1 putative acyl-coenzyme A synthetase [Colletotrichum sp. SAR 10_77]